MSENLIKIETYKVYDDLVNLKGKVIIPEIKMEVNIPLNKKLYLFNYEVNEDLVINPREYNNIILSVIPNWKSDFQVSALSQLLSTGENPTEILSFRLQVTCPKSRWCSEQKRIEISNIKKEQQYLFEIPISEVKETLKIEGYITREIDLKGRSEFLSEASLSIVSRSKDLIVLIDEIKEIGGEYLPIGPGNIGDLAFEFQGLNNPFELPRILYSQDLQEYLTNEDLASVKSGLLLSIFYFFDRYLKWLVFTCRIDINDKFHRAVVDLLSRYCLVSIDDLIALSDEEKYSEQQVRKYLDLSDRLFKEIQLQNKYKRELKNIFKSENK
jgi:hypothetical protein